MLLASLPSGLTAEDLLKRRARALSRKDSWRSIYQDAFKYACPQRESWSWNAPGQKKDATLYEGTLQEATYQAANTMLSLLMPQWQRWATLTPGDLFAPDEVPEEIQKGLQKATELFFSALNHSNFYSVIAEVCTDLLVGTAALSFDEGTPGQPFKFSAIPLSAIEIEEGPDGTVENTYMCRKIAPRHLSRVFQGLDDKGLPPELAKALAEKPDVEVEVIQCQVYDPRSGSYYSVAIHNGAQFWVWDLGNSCATIVARAGKVSGETYGRGRVLLALSDAKTLNAMQEFALRQAALQVAPPLLGVSDGILNPYTAQLIPNSVIPVSDVESLKPLLAGGNFSISEALMQDLRQRIRRTMLGPDAADAGPVRTATEVGISDRNRLWALGGEFIRVQNELISKVVKRGVVILARLGMIPEFKIDGRAVNVQWTSPFAQSQNSQDVAALERTLQLSASLGGPVVMQGLNVEDVPAWVARKNGVDVALIRTAEERQQMQAMAQQAVAAQQPQAPPQ